jgi:hypothetical protein
MRSWASELGEVAAWCNALLGAIASRIEAWPGTVELDVGICERAVLPRHAGVGHADPHAGDAGGRRRAKLAGVAAQVVVCGHTHVQYDRRVRGSGRQRRERRDAVRRVSRRPLGARGPDGIELDRVRRGVGARGCGTGFPLIEQWLAPVLRGETTAEEATDEFERRRRGA